MWRVLSRKMNEWMRMFVIRCFCSCFMGSFLYWGSRREKNEIEKIALKRSGPMGVHVFEYSEECNGQMTHEKYLRLTISSIESIYRRKLASDKDMLSCFHVKCVHTHAISVCLFWECSVKLYYRVRTVITAFYTFPEWFVQRRRPLNSYAKILFL